MEQHGRRNNPLVKKCSNCQLQKTTRIKRQCEAIIPDTLLNPNDKIAMDIFGPLL